MYNTVSNQIKVVVGSWGSYNACNERALGSKWLTLNDYTDADEIREELRREGFRLDGIDEELFVQDIEGLPTSGANWDYVNPLTLFEQLNEAGVLDDESAYFRFIIALDEYSTIEEALNNIDRIEVYEGITLEEYAEEMMRDCYNIPPELENYIDFSLFASDLSFDGYREFEINGVCGVYWIG